MPHKAATSSKSAAAGLPAVTYPMAVHHHLLTELRVPVCRRVLSDFGMVMFR